MVGRDWFPRMTWHLLIPKPGAGCPWQGRLHLLQTREEVEGTSETTGSAVWEVVMVEVREAGDADDVDTTAAYEVAGEMEDGVEAAGAAAGKEEGGAEAAFAAKEA